MEKDYYAAPGDPAYSVDIDNTHCESARWYYDQSGFKDFDFDVEFHYVSSFKNYTTGSVEPICISNGLLPSSDSCLVKDQDLNKFDVTATLTTFE